MSHPDPTERELTDWAEHDAHAGDAPDPDDETRDPELPPALEIPRHWRADDSVCPWSGTPSMSGICPDNCGPAGIHRDARYAIVVTRPADPAGGMDAAVFRFGPVHRGTVGGWHASLSMTLTGSAPEGTTVEVEPYRPLPPTGHSYVPPEAIPDDVESLLPPFRADQGYPDNGGFPDLHALLVMKHGHHRASELWDEACRRVDEEDQYEEAAQVIDATAAAALAYITEAGTAVSLAHLQVTKLIATQGAFEMDFPNDGHPSDARYHLDAVLLALRAAERVLRPTG